MRTNPDQREHLFDRPRNVRRLLGTLYAACGILLALDFILQRHALHAWDRLPGFYGLFGFSACVSLVLIAKLLRRLLRRAEDYYDVDA
ncbi:MAG: hypothetical protein R3F42_02440 [Pseudomonadota bacterium]